VLLAQVTFHTVKVVNLEKGVHLPKVFKGRVPSSAVKSKQSRGDHGFYGDM
jgi:hypothetical protein